MQLAMLRPSTSPVRHRQAVQPASLHVVKIKQIQPPQDSIVGKANFGALHRCRQWAGSQLHAAPPEFAARPCAPGAPEGRVSAAAEQRVSERNW